MNKKGVEFTFSWIFAIIAGSVILFSAIYITTKLMGSSGQQGDTLVSGELANILSPIETNLEDNKYTVIEFSQETKVYNECDYMGNFGVQKISTSSRTSKDKKWSEQSVRKSVYNKYIFSNEVEETDNKKLRVVVNPVYLPFKIGDVIILYGGSYCFVNPTNSIEETINDLSANGANNIKINVTSDERNCPLNATRVCFDRIGCDVNVNTQAKIVNKENKDLYYSNDALLLAAIFADSEVYECQIKRLAKRAGELAAVYSKKAVYMESEGCSNNLVNDLQTFVLNVQINSSRELSRILVPLAEDLERSNDGLASCKIF